MFAATVHARALALLALIGLLALGAALWATTAQGAEHLDGPALEEGYGAELSGDNEVPAVDSAASGSFLIDLDPGEVDFDEPSASWSIWLANVQEITQAHIHLGAEGENGGVIVFLLDPDDPGVSTPTSVHFEGSFDVSDLIGDLAEDWDGFVAAYEEAGLYVNVHSVANPGGEVRGQILFGPDPAAPTIGVSVSSGSSLFGWFGASVTSSYLLDEYEVIVAVWYLDAEGWVLDSRELPDFLRVDILIDLGTGILIIATDDFILEVPLA